jgi:DNA-binding NtrC family response regulator
MPRSALIIEDDADIAESLRYNLEGGLQATVAAQVSGLSMALDRITRRLHSSGFDLPGTNGIGSVAAFVAKIKPAGYRS